MIKILNFQRYFANQNIPKQEKLHSFPFRVRMVLLWTDSHVQSY